MFCFQICRNQKEAIAIKQSVVLQDLTNSVDNNQHPEPGNFNYQKPEDYKNFEDIRNYDLLEECRLTEKLFNNENLLFHSSIKISTTFVNNITEGEDNRGNTVTVHDETYTSLNTNNNIDHNPNLEDRESVSRTDNNKHKSKNLLELGQSDTGIKIIGNVKQNGDSDANFEVEQEAGENDSTDDEGENNSTDGEVSDQGRDLEEIEQENISSDDDFGYQDVDRKWKKKRKFSNSQEWKYNAIQRKRENGLEYTGRKSKEFKIKQPKKLWRIDVNVEKQIIQKSSALK